MPRPGVKDELTRSPLCPSCVACQQYGFFLMPSLTFPLFALHHLKTNYPCHATEHHLYVDVIFRLLKVHDTVTGARGVDLRT